MVSRIILALALAVGVSAFGPITLKECPMEQTRECGYEVGLDPAGCGGVCTAVGDPCGLKLGTALPLTTYKGTCFPAPGAATDTVITDFTCGCCDGEEGTTDGTNELPMCA